MSLGVDLAYNKPKRNLDVAVLRRALLYLDTATRELATKISEYILTHDCGRELVFELMTLLHWCSDRAWHAVSQHVQILDELGFEPRYARPDMALIGYQIDFEALAERFQVLFPEISKVEAYVAGIPYNEFRNHIKKVAEELQIFLERLGLDDYEEKFMDYGNVKKLGIFIREYRCKKCGKGFAVDVARILKKCPNCNARTLVPERWQLYPPPNAPVWNYCQPPKVYLEELSKQGLKFEGKKKR